MNGPSATAATLSPALFPGGKPIVGVLPLVQSDPLKVLERATLEFGPVAYLPVPIVNSYVLGTPKLAHHVLVANAKNYIKQTRGYDMLRLVLGNGLVTSEGDFWKRQRRIAQPAFHRERIAGFGAIISRAAAQMLDGWQEGAPFDLAEEMMHVTLRIVGEALLSTDVTKEADDVGDALTVGLEHLIHRTTRPLSAPQWVPTPRNLRFKRALSRLDEVVMNIITQRRQGGGPTNDLLAMLMESKDPETGEGMTDAQLRDEVMTIFLAGHETTANNLSWTFKLLAENPEVEAKLFAEVRDVLQGAAPAMESLPRLPFVANTIKESLRLYPPVWTLGRRVVEDDVVEGFLLEKDSLVFVAPWAIHRLPEFWPEPLRFNPERWLQDDPRRQHGSYLPFSMGQRKCIGDTFALVEAQLILAAVVQRFHVALVPGQNIVPEPMITLRPRDGIQVTVRRR